MSILRFKNIIHVEKLELYPVDILIIKYSKLLNLLDYRTGIDSNVISFRKKNHLLQTNKNREVNIFSEGEIKFGMEHDQLKITWYVKLDLLFFLSILVGIVSGLLSNLFAKLNLLSTITIALIFCAITIVIGLFTIYGKIDEVNSTCLNKDIK